MPVTIGSSGLYPVHGLHKRGLGATTIFGLAVTGVAKVAFAKSDPKARREFEIL